VPFAPKLGARGGSRTHKPIGLSYRGLPSSRHSC